MGLCRNGEYTRKTQNNLEEINILTTTHTYQDIVGY